MKGGIAVEKFRKALNIVSIISSTVALVVAVKALCAKTDIVENTEN